MGLYLDCYQNGHEHWWHLGSLVVLLRSYSINNVNAINDPNTPTAINNSSTWVDLINQAIGNGLSVVDQVHFKVGQFTGLPGWQADPANPWVTVIVVVVVVAVAVAAVVVGGGSGGSCTLGIGGTYGFSCGGNDVSGGYSCRLSAYQIGIAVRRPSRVHLPESRTLTEEENLHRGS